MLRILYLSGFAVLLVVMATALPAVAQPDASSSTAATTPSVNYFDFFVVKGGYIAFGLIALSVVTLALTIEHCVSIRRGTITPTDAVTRVKELIDRKAYLEAIQFCSNEPTMLGYVLQAGLLEARNGFMSMERAIEETLDERSARMFRKIEYLNIIGNVAPMIGLLGTVTGMILLFAEIHAADAFPGARIVADKIAVALITTFWGLAVAIPSLSIYGVFRNRIDVLTAECALTAEQLLAVFKPGSDAASAVTSDSATLPATASPGTQPPGAKPQPGPKSPPTTGGTKPPAA